MLHARLPLSLCNFEGLLHERGADIGQKTVRFWCHRYGPTFVAVIRKRRRETGKSKVRVASRLRSVGESCLKDRTRGFPRPNRSAARHGRPIDFVDEEAAASGLAPDHIMSPIPPMPPPPMPPAWPFGSGFSAIMASVVMSSAATEAASCSAVRTTLAGSITPNLYMSPYSSVWALKPKAGSFDSMILPATTEPSTPAFSAICRSGA